MHGGQAMLKAIAAERNRFYFSSPGSEWPPVWEALAEANAAQGIKKPGYVNCRHEAVAVAMAAGYTKVTGRPQVVMLHATAGPLNAAMTLRAALQERTPMVIISGEIAAYGENTKVADPGGQWLHDLDRSRRLAGFAARLRQVGRSRDVRRASRADHRARRAHRRRTAGRSGADRHSLRMHDGRSQLAGAEQAQRSRARPTQVDDAAIDKALNLIADAKNPVAVTEHVGGDPRAVERLVELCELFGDSGDGNLPARVREFPDAPSALSAPRSEGSSTPRIWCSWSMP